MHDGAHMRTLVADARVAMCRRINRTFAFPPSTVVPFYALPHCLASHAAYRKHSLTCSVFFPFFSFFFFLLPPFRSSNPASLRGRILRVRRIYVATFGRDPKRTFYYADDASGHGGWKKGSSSFPDHHPFRIFSFARNILFNERGRKISCKFLFVSRVLRRG